MSKNKGLIIKDLSMEYYVTIKIRFKSIFIKWENVHCIFLVKKQTYKTHAYYYPIIYLYIYV